MLSPTDVIHGWNPAGMDDEDVNVSPDSFFMTIQSLPSSTFLGATCPPLALPTPPPKPYLESRSQPRPQPQQSIPPPAPLTQSAVSRPAIAPSSDRRAQRNRNRDPSWIPRPRNAFIIFRCDYSREHSQGSLDPPIDEDDQNNTTVKTLSKRAAEAWKQLPPSERERYKTLADREREEHEKLYPHYRFRPMKRQVSGTRKNSTTMTTMTALETSKCARLTLAERPCAPSKRKPSVFASAPEKPRKIPSKERVEISAHIPRSKVVPPAPLCELPPTYLKETQTEFPPQLDFDDPLLFSTISDLPSPSSFDFCSPLHSISSSDTFSCGYNSTFGLDQTKDDLDREKALEAYAIGLYNFDLFSPFTFPEHC